MCRNLVDLDIPESSKQNRENASSSPDKPIQDNAAVPTQNNAIEAAEIWRYVREKNANRKQTKAHKD